MEGFAFRYCERAESVGSTGSLAYRACEVDMAEARTIRGTFWLKKALGLVAPARAASRLAHPSACFEAIRSSPPCERARERETYCAWQRGRAVERSSWAAWGGKDLEEQRWQVKTGSMGNCLISPGIRSFDSLSLSLGLKIRDELLRTGTALGSSV